MENQQAIFIDFENIALWAEREFFDFELTPLIEYVQTRGPAVVKRAYGDWGRFLKYRDELMNLSIDLIQIYSTRAGKNRADIRMAIDAMEIAITRPQVKNFILVSGDSDFSPLAAKLREYGRYTLGLGPRSITHDLLVRSCDEFVYLETLLGDSSETEIQSGPELETARLTLMKAVKAHGQRGELPVLAAKLKQTMLLMDPAFNEANFGYSQFKSWLEDNQDLINLYVRDLQLYVAPPDFDRISDLDLFQVEVKHEDNTQPYKPSHIYIQYQHIFNRLKMTSSDLNTRRDVLRDIYRELLDAEKVKNTEDLLDELRERYSTQDILRSKLVLQEILQLAVHQGVVEPGEMTSSGKSKIKLASGIYSEAEFIRRSESDFVFTLISAGIDIDHQELAYLLLEDREQTDYIQSLCNDLLSRGVIVQLESGYRLAGSDKIPFRDQPELRVVLDDIESYKLPNGMERGVKVAQSLAKTALVQRSQDFIASTSNYRLACKLMLDAFDRDEAGATLQELHWVLASYASAQAGKLSQVDRDYAAARPYYLAFFALVKEGDPLWSRMRGLINPMLSYYWANMGRELEINTNPWNIGVATPAQIAVSVAAYPNENLHQQWFEQTKALAQVNPGLLQRIIDQIMLNSSDSPENIQVAEEMQAMLPK